MRADRRASVENEKNPAYRGSPLRQQLLCLRNVRHLVGRRRVVWALAPPRAVTFVVVVDDAEGDGDGDDSTAHAKSAPTRSSFRDHLHVSGAVGHLFQETISDML